MAGDAKAKQAPDEKAISGGTPKQSIKCKVETEGMDAGDSLMFHIFLVRKGEADRKLTTESGFVGKGRKDYAAEVTWRIPETAGAGPWITKTDKLYFIARSSQHKVEVKSPLLSLVSSEFAVWLEIDLDNPKAEDDVLILLDAADKEVRRFAVKDMQESEPDRVRIVFGEVDMAAKYSLIRDYGDDEDGGKEILFEDMSPNEILALDVDEEK